MDLRFFYKRTVSFTVLKFGTGSSFGYYFRYGITHNGVDEEWKEQKAFTINILKQFSSGKNLIEQIIVGESKKLLQRIENENEIGQSSGINLKPDLDLFVGNIFMSILVGRTYEKDDPIFRQLIENLEETTKVYSSLRLHLLRICFLLRFVPILNHFGFDDMMRVNTDFLDIIINEYRAHQAKIKDDPTRELNEFVTIYLEGKFFTNVLTVLS